MSRTMFLNIDPDLSHLCLPLCMEPGEGDAGAFIFVYGAYTLASFIAFAYWYRCTSLNLNARAKFLNYMMHLS